jgi:hypothetical protein
MSWAIAYNIPTFTPASYQDNDTYGEDCTIEMKNRETTIVSIGTPQVARTDGSPAGAGDMQVSSVTILTGDVKFAWKGSGGMVDLAYYITFPLTLANGDIINRTVLVPVPRYVG